MSAAPHTSADPSGRSPRRGRRPGTADTRQAILDAAREEFAARGFDRATIRGIATAAGVDPALVLHYFGCEAQLFGSAISLPREPAEILRRPAAAGADTIGTTVVRSYLDSWDQQENRPRLVALLRSAMTNDAALEQVHGYLDREVFGPVAQELALPDGELRATLVESQLIGLAMMRYVTHIEPLASASKDDLVAAVGPSIQRYLTEALSLEAQSAGPRDAP